MTDLLRYDFGYEWPWTWGHLIAAVAFALMGAACVWRGWRLRAVTCAVLTAWALAGAFIVNVVLAFSIPAPLPTPRFLESGRGRVLDAGAGSGRSTLMVLQARPEAKVTALDIFDQRYGIFLRPGDWLVIAGGAGLVVITLPLLWQGGFADRAIIRQDGQVFAEVDLASRRDLAVPGPLGTTLVAIEPGRARIVADPGPRQYCVRQGWLARPGEIAICAPNRVSVQIAGRTRAYDSLSY